MLTSDYVVVGGDFNLPETGWQDKLPVTRCKSSLYTTLESLIIVNSLYQFVNVPTRFGGTSASTLDLVFSNHPTLVRSVTTITGISDHEVVDGNIRCEALDIKKPPSRKAFFYDRGNFEGLSNNLSSILPEFEECSLHMNINSLWNLFKSELAELVDRRVPSKIIIGKRRVDKP